MNGETTNLKKYMALILEKLKNVKAFFFDVDGVLSDGKVILTENGEQLRTMSVKDGYAIKKALNNGFLIAIISGGSSEGVKKRLEFLGIPEIYLGIKKKIEVYDMLLEKHGLEPENVLYMGDDIPDLPPLIKSGIKTCPSDAVAEVKSFCDYISPQKGGMECVRDVIEKTLKVQGYWLNV
jgi:3-deoxy-D-manno-octulosonate 8-phosphate phosphatase (KDO 8-P phosphatase)